MCAGRSVERTSSLVPLVNGRYPLSMCCPCSQNSRAAYDKLATTISLMCGAFASAPEGASATCCCVAPSCLAHFCAAGRHSPCVGDSETVGDVLGGGGGGGGNGRFRDGAALGSEPGRARAALLSRRQWDGPSSGRSSVDVARVVLPGLKSGSNSHT